MNNWTKKDEKFEFLEILSKKHSLRRFEAIEIIGKSPSEANVFLDVLEKQSLIHIQKTSDPNMDMIMFPGEIQKKSFNDIFNA
jgi:lysine/ornithine N-monooxygenase